MVSKTIKVGWKMRAASSLNWFWSVQGSTIALIASL